MAVPQILPPGTHRALRRENRLQATFSGHSTRDRPVGNRRRTRPIMWARFPSQRLRRGIRVPRPPWHSQVIRARPLKTMVQKFIGDAVREAIKSNAAQSGVLAVSILNENLSLD